MQAFTSEAKSKQIDLVVEFGASLDQTHISAIKTDHVRLRQIVTNLISNAVRFTANSLTRVITVRYDVSLVPPEDNSCGFPEVGVSRREAAETGGGVGLKEDTPVWLFVSVTDTGPGLGPEEQNNLFKRFSRESDYASTS